MKVSGFTIVRNGIKFDYPFIESIKSVLPLCAEMVVEDLKIAKQHALLKAHGYQPAVSVEQ